MATTAYREGDIIFERKPSTPRIDTKQVIHNNLRLEEIPDDFANITISGFTQVFNQRDITATTFYVHPKSHKIEFHPSQEGKSFTVNYNGIGRELIPQSMIYTDIDNNGVVKTLNTLTDEAKAMIVTAKDTVDTVKRLEPTVAEGKILNTNLGDKISTGTPLNTSLGEKIATGTPLNTNLGNNINTGTTLNDKLTKNNTDGATLHNTLNQDITNATNADSKLKTTTDSALTTDTNLTTKIFEGNTKENTLNNAVANAQGAINTIRNTENKSFTVLANQFILNSTTGKYEYTLAHNMNSENLMLYFRNSNKDEIFVDSKPITTNSMLLSLLEPQEVKVTISVSYFGYMDTVDRLNEAVFNANQTMEKIEQKGNKAFTILSTDFVWDATANTYKYNLLHNCNTRNIVSAYYDINGDKLAVGEKIVDLNNMLIFHTKQEQVTVILNLQYMGYLGKKPSLSGFNTDDLTETANRRFVTTQEKSDIGDVKSELQGARQGKATLTQNLEDIKLQLSEENNSTSHTLAFLNGINLLRTRSIIIANGFYSIDDNEEYKYRVLSVDGNEVWTDIKDSNNTLIYQISNKAEIRAGNGVKKLKPMLKNGKINFKAIGAKNNDVSFDNTVLLQLLLSYLETINGGVVIVPCQKFYFKGTITVPAFCSIEGGIITGRDENNGTIFEHNPTTSNTKFFTFKKYQYYCYGNTLKNITIRGNSATGEMVDLNQTAYTVFDGVSLLYGGTSLKITGGMLNTFRNVNMSYFRDYGLLIKKDYLTTTQRFYDCYIGQTASSNTAIPLKVETGAVTDTSFYSLTMESTNQGLYINMKNKVSFYDIYIENIGANTPASIFNIGVLETGETAPTGWEYKGIVNFTGGYAIGSVLANTTSGKNLFNVNCIDVLSVDNLRYGSYNKTLVFQPSNITNGIIFTNCYGMGVTNDINVITDGKFKSYNCGVSNGGTYTFDSNIKKYDDFINGDSVFKARGTIVSSDNLNDIKFVCNGTFMYYSNGTTANNFPYANANGMLICNFQPDGGGSGMVSQIWRGIDNSFWYRMSSNKGSAWTIWKQST